MIAACFIGCENQNKRASEMFVSEKVLRTASFTIEENIDILFPLFGAFEERKWEPHWNPTLIYPDEEIIEEGTTFKTETHGNPHEAEYFWVVSKYEPENYLIQYLVFTMNRHWTITVKCESIKESRTRTTVTYSYVGLNELGNELNAHVIEAMYKHNLQDWKDALNKYLESL